MRRKLNASRQLFTSLDTAITPKKRRTLVLRPGQGLTVLHNVPDPGAEMSAAVTAALVAHRASAAAPNPVRA
jgi:hypothetical protein